MVKIGSGLKAGHYTGGRGPGLKGVTSRSKGSVSLLKMPKMAKGIGKVSAIKKGKVSYPNPLRG